MPVYKIHNTIESAANLWDVEVNGYRFEQVEATGSDLVVSKSIDAADFRAALKLFNEGLFPVLDGIALHRLSATSAYGTSLLIEKEGANHAFLKTLHKRLGTGLTLTGSGKFDPAIMEIEKLADSRDPALFYFRHALLSHNIISATMHFLQATESLAGTIETTSTCRNKSCKASPIKCAECKQEVRPIITNHKALKALLGKATYKYFYTVPVDGNSIRNKVFHGYTVDGYELAEWHEHLEEATKKALINKYDLKAIPGVKGTRSLISYGIATIMVRYTEPLPALPELIKRMEERRINSDSEPAFIFDNVKELIDSF